MEKEHYVMQMEILNIQVIGLMISMKEEENIIVKIINII